MMNSPKSCSSPSYKNVILRLKQSPIELKEKLRKDYKNKVQSCRDMLINRFRGNDIRPEIHDTFKEIYKNLYNFTDPSLNDDEEIKVLEEVKNELIQEELQWWQEEYDKSLLELDWSALHQDQNVICPICQKNNFEVLSCAVICPNCKITIKTNKSLLEIHQIILDMVEKHSDSCSNEPQFTSIKETTEAHIYLICDGCAEMQLLI